MAPLKQNRVTGVNGETGASATEHADLHFKRGKGHVSPMGEILAEEGL